MYGSGQPYVASAMDHFTRAEAIITRLQQNAYRI